MKILTKEEANSYLSQIGIQIGEWNQLQLIGKEKNEGRSWFNYRAPKNALELHNFSMHLVEWLPKGRWTLFQVDNSNTFNKDELFLFQRLLCCAEQSTNIGDMRSFLFEFTGDNRNDWYTNLIIGNLIHIFLLFSGHGYVVSSGASVAEHLGIQDGFAYFISCEGDLLSARALLKSYEKDPLMSPQWIIDGLE